MPDLLFEVGVEEIPASFVPIAAAQLESRARETFSKLRLGAPSVKVFVTPRRMVLAAQGLPDCQEDAVVEVRGPSVVAAFDGEGRPTRAAEGFARAQGVRVEELVSKVIPQGEYVFAVRREKGKPAGEVLPEALSELVMGMEFPKSMRWGEGKYRFCRPVRWVVALLDSEVLPVEVAGIRAGRHTRGHRVLAPGAHEVQDLRDFLEKMPQLGVVLDQEERKRLIINQATRVAAGCGGVLVDNPELLEHVANLVEWPTAFCGEFAPEYLEMPQEVLITVMAHHQKYFAVRDGAGNLMPKFIGVRNGGTEYLDLVQKGNEKVIQARLADAKFFYSEDLKRKLWERVADLDRLIFQEKLGSMGAKVRRIQSLVELLCDQLQVDQRTRAVTSRAALLCRADLTTNMVKEFPELQGVMGKRYALENGEGQEVAQAIFESYLPAGSGGALPETLPGKLVAAADKADTLVGIFGVGLKPTGSQDPYALRRHGTALVGIAASLPRPVVLRWLLGAAASLLSNTVPVGPAVVDEVMEFLVGRLRTALGERGIRYDVIEAVLASKWDDPRDVFLRAEALAEFAKEPDFNKFMVAFRRAANLSKDSEPGAVRPELLVEPEERQLYSAFLAVGDEARRALDTRDYGLFLRTMSKLYEPVNQFLNKVLVMCPDLDVRKNRLLLLKNIALLFTEAADPGRLVVE
ncbi:MAG: glycine--tRNA ligase subunit beta [Bacillota bacterium]